MDKENINGKLKDEYIFILSYQHSLAEDPLKFSQLTYKKLEWNLRIQTESSLGVEGGLSSVFRVFPDKCNLG